jgi:outer membrane protein OmpA-like peptidoglycan-associated protein
MSVDFSQFFNGPIRDSLIAQVSGYLDISRQQATTAYDKAVALVIGAMARQASKPEGAQALTAHIQNSQTQTSLTSSALSPTVLTNDQFAQIVTLGESEQAVILGPQQEAVTTHLEVATGLDTKAVGSLLSIVVPFVLSFLKNNIPIEGEPAQSLPVLLATQAPHVAAQLDAPALAALGEDSLEGLFGPNALAAVDANAATSQNGKHGPAQGTMANEKPANGWFKWVLTLAVVLAGAAWIKSCTQSDTTTTENAKPADQQQSATDAPAPDAATAPTAVPATPGAATEPSANFPAPASTQSAGQAEAPAAEGAQADSTKPESAQAESADQPATPVAPAATESKEAVPPADEQSESASGQEVAPATDSAQPDAAATPASEPAADTTAAGPTYGQASDTMEPEAQSDASTSAASAEAVSSAAQTTEQKATSSEQEDNTDSAKTQATGADKTKSDQEPAPAAEGAAATTTAPAASSAAVEQAGSSSAATDSAATGNATTDSAATDNAAPGKTTTFAEPAPIADKPDSQPAAATPEPSGAAGKTTTFAGSDSSSSQSAPAQPQEEKADQPADTQSGTAPASNEATPSATTTESSGKTTTFGAGGQDTSASGSATQTDSTATPAEGAGQTPVVTEPAANSAQAGAVARLELERDGDALRIRGTVPDESARNRILSAAKFVDGHSKIEDELKVDSQAAASTFDDYSGLLSLLRGYHDVNVSLEQQALKLTGQVSSNEEKEALTTKVQNLVGANIQVDNQTEVATPARTPDVAGAPATLPQVQFASGSAQVDSRYHDDLDQYAQQLKASGKSVQLIGFADESGSEPGNETLSKRRAESVKAYLILRGVQDQQIQTNGQGTQAPVADNTTEAGRAKNRRVEIREQQ